MKTTLFYLFLLAFTITNAIFIFMIHNTLKIHEDVVNRHGMIISFMLATPEIKSSLDREIMRQQSTQATSTKN